MRPNVSLSTDQDNFCYIDSLDLFRNLCDWTENQICDALNKFKKKIKNRLNKSHKAQTLITNGVSFKEKKKE